MNRRSAPYIIAPVLILLAGLVGYLMKGDSPREVKAETLFLGERVTTPTVRKSPDPAPVDELPEAQRVLISGTGGLDSSSYFNCWITNRSDWTVTELRFWIAVGNDEGSTRWERNYHEYVNLPPNTARRIRFKVNDGQHVETLWKITSASGTPSR